ncbi:hypothetical protein JHK86_018824 [Glycine max]|nr:hypothetical protein JHK86_018824 [Glycine max]
MIEDKSLQMCAVTTFLMGCSLKNQLPLNDGHLTYSPPPPKWKKKIDSPIVEAALNDFVDLILKDFVINMWYANITPDMEFPELVHDLIMHAIAEVSARVKEINLVDLLTRDIVDLIGDHIDLFRRNQAAIGVDVMLTLSSEERDGRLKFCLLNSKELHLALMSPKSEYKLESSPDHDKEFSSETDHRVDEVKDFNKYKDSLKRFSSASLVGIQTHEGGSPRSEFHTAESEKHGEGFLGKSSFDMVFRREAHVVPKLQCRVLGAYFEKLGSTSFAVYSIVVTDGQEKTWFVRRGYSYSKHGYPRVRILYYGPSCRGLWAQSMNNAGVHLFYNSTLVRKMTVSKD